MPDSLRLPALRPRTDALTAAATSYTASEWRSGQLFGFQPWQNEAWGFRRTLGEYSQAIDWQARVMSRVRLGAAEIIPGGDEPEMLTEGAAAQLMQDFCGGGPGHSAFLRAITPQLLIPGEGWLIAERDDPFAPLATADWGVYSTECVQGLGSTFQVRVGPGQWRYLLPDNLPLRIYDPDPQWPWLATSNSEAAVPIMRRIFLIDSRIVAMMVSRLAMNGLMLIPQEGIIGVPAQYKEAPDPFVAMLIDIASKNIANPGNASAAIPIPIRFTKDLIDQWKILKSDDPLDEWLLKEREDELGRLGDALGIARERVSGGMGEQNHWGAWQASEEEVKVTFSTLAETICGGITKGFLIPCLRDSGQSLVGPRGGRIIAWYDVSELTSRPDLGDRVIQAYDRLEASGEALRRELGLSETDAPTPDELDMMAWKKQVAVPELAPTAIANLTGGPMPAPPVPPTSTAGPATEAPGGASPAGPAVGPPARPVPAAAPTAGPPPGFTAGAVIVNGHDPRRPKRHEPRHVAPRR